MQPGPAIATSTREAGIGMQHLRSHHSLTPVLCMLLTLLLPGGAGGGRPG
jgi:hypothetical protein